MHALKPCGNLRRELARYSIAAQARAPRERQKTKTDEEGQWRQRRRWGITCNEGKRVIQFKRIKKRGKRG